MLKSPIVSPGFIYLFREALLITNNDNLLLQQMFSNRCRYVYRLQHRDCTWLFCSPITVLWLVFNHIIQNLLRTVSLRLQDQRLAMCLTDTSGTIDLHVNDYLVSSGFAQFAESAKDVPTQDLEQVCLCHKIKCCCVKNNQLYMCMYIGDVCIWFEVKIISFSTRKI